MSARVKSAQPVMNNGLSDYRFGPRASGSTKISKGQLVYKKTENKKKTAVALSCERLEAAEETKRCLCHIMAHRGAIGARQKRSRATRPIYSSIASRVQQKFFLLRRKRFSDNCPRQARGMSAKDLVRVGILSFE